jgi:hypothetical protein
MFGMVENIPDPFRIFGRLPKFKIRGVSTEGGEIYGIESLGRKLCAGPIDETPVAWDQLHEPTGVVTETIPGDATEAGFI